ncbi:MAG: lysostaphin resistance A-like protein [Vicinamibacterales bacterium]
MTRKAGLLLCAAIAYAVGFQPSAWLRDAVLASFGNPPYRGVWILIPHALLYSTLSALICLLLWRALIRMAWLEAMPLAVTRAAVVWGLAGGAATAGATFAVFAATQPGAIHPPHVNLWLAAANLFSNFYEEFIYRGFLLAALTAVFGVWPAAVLSSVAFGATHVQYPLAFQAFIAFFGLVWCWLVRRTGSLWSAWIAHMGLDWLADPFIG